MFHNKEQELNNTQKMNKKNEKEIKGTKIKAH
jgi:hypothetical protein